MNKEQFIKEVINDFLDNMRTDERPASAWCLSLRLWSAERFNEEFRKEHPKKNDLMPDGKTHL